MFTVWQTKKSVHWPLLIADIAQFFRLGSHLLPWSFNAIFTGIYTLSLTVQTSWNRPPKPLTKPWLETIIIIKSLKENWVQNGPPMIFFNLIADYTCVEYLLTCNVVVLSWVPNHIDCLAHVRDLMSSPVGLTKQTLHLIARVAELPQLVVNEALVISRDILGCRVRRSLPSPPI